MIKIEFAIREDRPLRILCIGAHSDDIEIGCGGTMLRLLAENRAEVYWVVLSANGKRNKEALASANSFLADAKDKKIIIKNFRESFFPYIGTEIKDFFENLKRELFPDVILSHYRYDLHQDHRLASELTWNTFRDHLILEYEVVKYDGDLGTPNFFVSLRREICRLKVDILLECFASQAKREWFTRDAFFSMLRIRGVESKAPHKYAEGFYCRKLVV
jgi:LmbE family N-acetylglucosaminyl deacetylase